jgi:hypothetical protein
MVDASQEAATLVVVLRDPPRPFIVSGNPPATLIFIAALTSRSCMAPQNRHSHSLTSSSFLPPISPQHEHRWLVGSHRLITRKSLPYIADLASSIVLKLHQPRSDIARDNFRFFTILDTARSSKTITWFSLIILVDNLCKKSLRTSEIFA